MAKHTRRTRRDCILEHIGELPGFSDTIDQAIKDAGINTIVQGAGVSGLKIESIHLNVSDTISPQAAQKCTMVLGPDGKWHIQCS